MKTHAKGITAALVAMIGLIGWTAREAASADLEPIQVGQPQRLEVFPPQIKLTGPRQKMHLVVTGYYADGSAQDLTRVAEIVSSDPSVVELAGAIARPKTDGHAEVIVKAGGQEAKVPVDVMNFGKPEPVPFENGALVSLSKQGCNSGACHGSPSGKGGFRLSLRAFDPNLDRQTLIREDYGRRSNPLDPEASLLLLKPLMKVPHGGGMKIHKSDPAYALLRDWIAEGCRLDAPDAARCVRIELYPPTGRLLRRPAHTQQLAVLGHFSDGTVRDVTDLAVFTSSDSEIADVSESGFVVGKDRGEAAIVVRYLEHIESTFLTFVKEIPGYVWNNPGSNNYIDDLVHAKLQQLQFLPSELSTDEEFLRRVFLDVVGLLPTVEETKAFLDDKAADKRAKLIDRLLERPEYAKFWALKWGDLLRMTNAQVGGDGVHKYHRWLERAIRDNLPYDEMARQLLSSSGSTLLNPAANFYRTAVDTNDCVESISQVFLGARLQCAKCHNHPFERWTQDNYYGMSAFFNRVQRQPGKRPGETFIFVAKAGEVTQPRTGKQMKPWAPVAGEISDADPDDRRKTFVQWLTKADNPYFAKIEANRIWSHLLGRGIVEPPDDFRDSNPPSNAALLDALTKDFVQHGFDRRHVIRTILNSRAYQASFKPNDFNKDDVKYFSHYQPRLLSAEQLLDAICYVTAVPETFGPLPQGTKATQLPAPDLVAHDFLKIFGQPERQTVCACERSTESNLGMAIQFFNGPLIYNKLRAENNRFRQLVQASQANPDVIRQLHLSAVCRAPTEKELEASLKHIETKAKQGVEKTVEIEAKLAQLAPQLEAAKQAPRQKLLDAKAGAIPEPIREDAKKALATAADQRNEVQKYLAEKFGPVLAVTDEEVAKATDEEMKKKIEELQKQFTEMSKQKTTPELDRLMALEDICWAILNTNEFLFQH